MEHSIAETVSHATAEVDLEAVAGGLARGEFVFHHQPLFSVPDREIVGYEALVRWVRPDGDVVFPDAFVDVIAAPPLSRRFDTYALEEGIRTARRLRGSGGNPATVWVNVSAETLTDPAFVDEVSGLCSASGLEPGALTLEILETTRPDSAAMASTLSRLRAAGVRIALDDFGTGYANLDVLLSLPLDILKLDRRLIASGDSAAPVLESMTALAHRLGLVVVVEGIETTEQWDLAARVGADMAQGFLLGRPGVLSC